MNDLLFKYLYDDEKGRAVYAIFTHKQNSATLDMAIGQCRFNIEDDSIESLEWASDASKV